MIKTNTIIQHDVTKDFPLPDSCIDVVITSPPYWGLRDYGVDGQIGLEKHPQEYIDKLVSVACEIKRVLKKSGSFYLNLGDTYFGGGNTTGQTGKEDDLHRMQNYAKEEYYKQRNKLRSNWMQPKQLMLIPVRVAIALQDDGWVLRNDIIWHKPNPMPSSVKDRLNNTFEHVFHFVKSKKYYYDLDAIREPHKIESIQRACRGRHSEKLDSKQYAIHYKEDFTGYHNMEERFENGELRAVNPAGKNPGDTIEGGAILGESGAIKVPGGKGWTKKVPGGGAACTKDPRWCPPEGKNPGDVAYAEWYFNEREKKSFHPHKEDLTQGWCQGERTEKRFPHPYGKNPGDFWDITTQPFTSYSRDLEHFAVFPKELIIKPLKASCPSGGVVLDPFCGRGTVGLVARELGLNYVLFDISPDYCELARLYVNGQKRKLIKNQGRLET